MGIWSDGTTIWVADFGDRKLYAYELSTGARQTSKEIDLHTENECSTPEETATDDNCSPRGIWSDGTTMWVIDTADVKVYAYNLSTGNRQAEKEFVLTGEGVQGGPSGIWSDGEVMWVSSPVTSRVFAYRLTDGARQPSREFDAVKSRLPQYSSDGLSRNIQGIWSDGTVMWIIDIGQVDLRDWTLPPRASAYRLSDGAHLPSLTFTHRPQNPHPNQYMWSDGTTMWITSRSPRRLEAYTLPRLPSAAPSTPPKVWAEPTDGGASVGWTASATRPWLIEFYEVTASPGGHSCTTRREYREGSLAYVGTGCGIGGLDNGVAYTFTVTAGNARGDLPASAPSKPIRPPGGSGDPPSGVTATAGDGSATVSWSPPADDGGSPVRGYTARSTPHNFRCYVTIANPDTPDNSCEFDGLDNGVAYTFTVVARNNFGTSRASQPSAPITPTGADPPNTPTKVRAQPNNNGEVKMSWLAPAYTGDSPITAYTATAATAAHVLTCTTAAALSCNFDRLSANADYTFSVVATNRHGNSAAASPPTPTIQACTHTPSSRFGGDGAPSAPSAVSAVPQIRVRDAQVRAQVWWATPSTGARSVDGYVVTASPCGRTCATNDSPASSSSGFTEAANTCGIYGLINGVTYTFTVEARSGSLFSPMSPPSNPTRLPGTSSDPPGGVTATAGDGSATVSWSPPAEDGGSPVSGYTARSTPHNFRCYVTIANPDTPDTSCEFDGLTNGVAYTFTVIARNHNGTSRASQPSAAVTPTGADPPDPPTKVRAQPSDTGPITVSWKAPAYTGDSPITAYTATATATDEGGAPTCTTATLACTFSTLTGGSRYAFSVVATTSRGDSPAAQPPSPVTLPTIGGL